MIEVRMLLADGTAGSRSCAYARGHHGSDTFLHAVEEDYPGLALGEVRHAWFRHLPHLTIETDCPGRGAYPVTVADEVGQ